ncbi:aminotransferase class V-fold PLP-dependent enzyme [Marivirga arenosa]|uniref:Aminotransferase class V-fold PLP-dependent enzyme n=1 Tax=Marivirga arenosa TaxID=3059076 RepID=A0AA51N830_9BACT|nr:MULTISPECIES: aminotransferase class V-fold PLP-dependent enzyme [unclassified Marivirga]WKK82958.2 aminotransferase class V-fold PLP-dependent enzyme [Marivirga sp. BKB1-2]WMN07884.1 aminotransferase class V-fold PLP-dependent enzyme [Marivirga sp. ABR2-2]
MENQKQLFNLPENIHYLNGAYMSPNLKTVEAAGILGIQRKTNPTSISEEDFFKPAEKVKSLFAELVNAPAQQIALIPSASYGLMNAIQNVPIKEGQHAITVNEEFPSDHLTLRHFCEKYQAELKVVSPPDFVEGRTESWTNQIIESITEDTALVVMSSIHWMEGLKFDLKAIGEKCRETNTYFIVDGTQSVGALPMDVEAFHIDALICAAYKWLLGPYSSGLAYYSEKFNEGIPLEYSWMTRKDSDDFSKLTEYPEDFGPNAMRYNVGEFSNFIALPMMQKALEQLLEWRPESIQNYCFELLNPLRDLLDQKGIEKEVDNRMSAHLYGLFVPDTIDLPQLMNSLKSNNIFVSARGSKIRISPNVYNDAEDVEALMGVLQKHL